MANQPAQKNRLFFNNLDYLMPRLSSMAASFNLSGSREDLIQEGLVACYCACLAYNENRGASYTTFALRCARNAMINACKSLSEPNEILTGDEVLDYIPSSKNSPEEDSIIREEYDRIYSFMRTSLSPYEQRVTALYLDGKTYPEIAEILGVTRKSVDCALSRVRRKLRSITENESA